MHMKGGWRFMCEEVHGMNVCGGRAREEGLGYGWYVSFCHREGLVWMYSAMFK
jgi:hypothetical protein